MVVEKVSYFNGVYDVERVVRKSELIPGIYYVYDEYEDGTYDVVHTPDRKVAMGLSEAAMLLDEVRC